MRASESCVPREVALVLHVEMAEQEVLAGLIDVGEVRTHDHFEHTGHGVLLIAPKRVAG
jgi:hypothetical protein